MPPFAKVIKRLIDVLVSFTLLLVLSPLLAFIAGAIRVNMGKPVLFRQQRPGLYGKPFMLFKFRTMRHPKPGEETAASDGVRLTRLGRILRSTSLDELPTLWNVLCGDMSLVGPRPLLMQYLDRYTPEQARRHNVKPGITGWAQVNGRNALSWEEKFAYDVWYVDHCSLWLDLRILLITLWKVITREGISHGSEATMPEFMGSAETKRNDHQKNDAPPHDGSASIRR
ncbi:MAG: sugar transferase [Desulfobacterota bacterium]|nr:sugar transferase [Thermodesulfobacteriota bacterium]